MTQAASNGSPAIAAIVVNFNAGNHLLRCLTSLRHSHPSVQDLIVVDNGSQDGSDVAAGRVGGVRLLHNAHNNGYGAAVNQAVLQTSAPVLLVLNPDCEFTPGAVDLLLQELGAHEECAVVGPGLINAAGELDGSARGDPTMLTGLFGRSGMLRRLPGVAAERDPATGPDRRCTEHRGRLGERCLHGRAP